VDKPTAWYDPTNGMVSTDKDSPLFTPLGQVWPLFLEEQQITADCPNCEYHRQRAQRWRDEAYKQAGHPLPEREQEPVAIVAEIHMSRYTIEWTNGDLPEGTKLYTTPPQRTWVGLTEEELYEIYDESDDGSSPCGVCGACSKCKIEVAIARAIEAKLKEKNT
jgi:hypothetical protein